MHRLVLLALLGACRLSSEDLLSEGDDGAGGLECQTADDCVLAASSCCACPDYATSDRELGAVCDEVDCPAPPAGACPALVAACVDHFCTTACAPAPCALICEGGFAADAAGCLVCACAEPTPPDRVECADDADCVQVPADCCGCARGGQDTAVPAAEAEAFHDSLMCSTDPSDGTCPEVDVCDPAAAPRCRGGACVLAVDGVDGPDEPPAAECGTPDLPPCPDGTACVLNSDEDASSQGLGTCQPGTP